MDSSLIDLYSQMLTPALLERVGPVFMRDHSRAGQVGSIGVGSAVVLSVDGRHIVLTAGHVLEDLHVAQLGLAPRGVGEFRDVEWLADREAFRVGGSGISTTGCDIGCFEISETERRRWGVTPISLDQVEVYQLRDEEPAILHGYPWDYASIEYGGTRSELNPATFFTRSVPQQNWDSVRYKPGLHQVLHYPNADVRVLGPEMRSGKLPDPHGISGSGIWTLHLRDDRPISFRSLMLVGIEHSWLKGDGVIVGNTMEAVLALVCKAFPDLSPTIFAARVRMTSE